MNIIHSLYSYSQNGLGIQKGRTNQDGGSKQHDLIFQKKMTCKNAERRQNWEGWSVQS